MVESAMSRSLRLLPFVFLLTIFAFAQENPTPQLQTRPAPSATPSGSERRVTVEVQVNEKSGAPVRGLQKEDFKLLDDKQPIDIVSFQAIDHSAAAATNPPVEIILVVDAVNAGFQAVTFQRDEIRKFLLKNNGKLAEPVSMVFFTDKDAKIHREPSTDGTTLATVYDQYQTGLRIVNRSQGIYGAGDRFTMSMKTMGELAAYAQTRPGRKLLIWLSPGWPLLSGPRIEVTAKEEQQLFRMIVNLSTALRQADITVYSIDPLGMADFGMRNFYYEEFLKGVPFANKAVPGDLALQVLSEQTGGRVIHTTNDLTTAIAQCSSDAEAYYILSFNPPKSDHADEFHSLSAVVNKPGVTARTRMGYYNEP
jgi:VWFA-related protein